jgi:hypothetical protein
MYSLWELIEKIDKPKNSQENLEAEKQALFELELEEKFKDYKKIIDFRQLILDLNKEL